MKDIQIIVTDDELNGLAEEIAAEMGIPLSDEPDQYFGTRVLTDLDVIENTMDMALLDSIGLPDTIFAKSVSVVFESTLGVDYVADIDGALEKFMSHNQLGALAA